MKETDDWHGKISWIDRITKRNVALLFGKQIFAVNLTNNNKIAISLSLSVAPFIIPCMQTSSK